MKDIIESIDSRIKSPLFGYYVFAAIALNWEELFYLFFDNGLVSERLSYFHNGTDDLTLFVYPFLIAATYSILYPWLSFVFMYISKKPTNLKNSLQAQTEHTLLIKKQELEKLRSMVLSNKENELIERAQRDAKLNEIQNINIREKLQAEIDQLRKERDVINTIKLPDPELSDDQEEIIRMITAAGGSITEQTIIATSKFDKVKTEYYLEDLENNNYLTKRYELSPIKDNVYSLTTKSKKLMVDKGIVQ